MQYHKFTFEDLVIEFHNNWLGEEKVFVNGQLVSRQSSVFGTNHRFEVIEKGEKVIFVLTTKVTDAMQVALDLRKNGVIIHENVIVSYGSKPKKPVNRAKNQGLAHLQEYELDQAVKSLQEALEMDVQDPEIWFHLGCAYSVMENVPEAYNCIKEAVSHKLNDIDMILQHEMLAYLRIQPAFEGFLQSQFTEYKLEEE